jgi:hypothetical protein
MQVMINPGLRAGVSHFSEHAWLGRDYCGVQWTVDLKRPSTKPIW